MFVPGISAPLLLYVVFGTTRTFRDYSTNLLVPRWLREKLFRSPGENPSKRTPGPPPVPPKDSKGYPPAYRSQHEPPLSPPLSPPMSPPLSPRQAPSEPESRKSHQGEHRIQILQRPRQHSRPQTRDEKYIQEERVPRESTSWYGARPSDLESGCDDDFTPAPQRSNSNRTHGTNINLKYLETASGRTRPSGPQRVVSQESRDDDEWPMLIPISPLPTALTPRPRTRSDPRI